MASVPKIGSLLKPSAISGSLKPKGLSGGLDAKAFAGLLGLEGALKEAIIKDKQALIARALFQSVVEVTPVLTGKARHNWIPTLGSAATQELSGVAGVTMTGAPMTGDEKSRIDAVLGVLKKTPLGQRVHITNNLNYVVFLDRGSSQKAPQGIRVVAVAKAKARLKLGV